MKKRYLSLCGIFTVLAFVLLINKNSKSNSEKYSNEQIYTLMDDYKKEYDHTFQMATKEIEKKLYGKWLVENDIGYDTSVTITGDALFKATVDISEDHYSTLTRAGVRYGSQAFQYKKPVFAYYNETFGDMTKDHMLHFSELKEIDNSQLGTVIIVMGLTASGQYDVMSERFIILGDKIIVESQQSYYELKRIEFSGCMTNYR